MIASDTCKWIRIEEIDIYESDRSFMGDDILVLGITNKDGAFKIGLKAKYHDSGWMPLWTFMSDSKEQKSIIHQKPIPKESECYSI